MLLETAFAAPCQALVFSAPGLVASLPERLAEAAVRYIVAFGGKAWPTQLMSETPSGVFENLASVEGPRPSTRAPRWCGDEPVGKMPSAEEKKPILLGD